ncbi:MAG TPA: hypothetical protein VFA18_22230 [Gemmataceae bacterium]|nr:hypothetical protein [Gemmataceae bacterium]
MELAAGPGFFFVMAKSKNISDALNRLAAAEERFLVSEFLAPVVRGGQVQVRIAGVICTLRLQPVDFEGWGVFRPASHTEAVLVRQAKLAERQRYLELFPLVRLILADKRDAQWLAVPAHRADTRFRIEGFIPVPFVEDAQTFEVIEARFDGTHFWYAGPDSRWDPAMASYLRRELEKLTPPENLHRAGLTAEERTAYALNYWPRYEASEEGRRSREERRLRSALQHAGAELKEYVERQDVYTITYEVDGQRHVSAISKNDLAVQVAGICLSGEDDKFDLQSLVGVIREAQGGAGLVRVGRDNAGMPEEQYWRAHPQS